MTRSFAAPPRAGRALSLAAWLLVAGGASALDFVALTSWVRRTGGLVHPAIALAEPAPCGSRGLVVTQAISAEEAQRQPLIVVPASLEINGNRARAALAAEAPGVGDLDDGAAVVLYLASLDAERRRSPPGADLFWRPYLASLPDALGALPNAWAPLVAGDDVEFERRLAAAAPADATEEGRWRLEARAAADYAARVSHGLAADFGAAVGVDAADLCWALGVVSSRAMGGAARPSLVPLLDLVNHDAGRSAFTSFDASSARMETRFAARELRAKRQTVRGARDAAAAYNLVADGEDWCLWSFDDAGTRAAPHALAEGDEVLASYLNDDYTRAEWFANTGFVARES